MLELSHVYHCAVEFDIIHFHVGVLPLTLASLVDTRTVHTLHGKFYRDNQAAYSHHQ